MRVTIFQKLDGFQFSKERRRALAGSASSSVRAEPDLRSSSRRCFRNYFSSMALAGRRKRREIAAAYERYRDKRSAPPPPRRPRRRAD
ncbi:hypothetical protein EVAR_11600_1 [Eumeta japonica]|uniref:Uncharacterized protein n=1 Tax=Eumeta variegata TaxID=151549 RepID=A0A4C1X587_EUMVA|nr:hypothetical protein EVAR_11600_1 [Eumeta japonica]